VKEAKAIHRGAELENRDPTPEAYGRLEELLAKSRQARHAEEAVHGIAGGIGGNGSSVRAGDGSGAFIGGDPGARWPDGRGHERTRGLLRQKPREHSGRAARGALRVQAGRVHGGERSDQLDR
jgi:hypothetical protein